MPSQFSLGVVQATYSSGWDSVLESQRVPGALVLEVLPDTAASDIGLQLGDIVVRIDDEEIRNRNQVSIAVRLSGDAQHHIVVAKRNGRTEEMDVTLRPAPDVSTVDFLESRLLKSPGPITQYLVASNINDFDRALSLLDSALQASPEFAPAYAQKALAIHEQASNLAADERQTKRPEIDEALVEAARLDPNSSELHALSARISLDYGDAISAETDALIALEFDQLSAESHHLLGRARVEQARAAEGFDDLRMAVALDPYMIDYYASLANCYRLLGDLESARLTIEAAKTLTDDETLKEQLDRILGNGD